MIRHLLLASAVCCACGAEFVVRDVHLGLGTRPSDFDFSVTTPTSSIKGSDAFDGGLSFEGGARWSFAAAGDSFGLIAGGDLGADALSYGGGDGLATMWARAAAGCGWALNDRITLLGEGMLGYGLSSLKLPGTTSAESFTADGTAMFYEGRITGTWQASRAFNIGLYAGWTVAQHDLSGDGVDVTLDQNGWTAGLQFGWRINDMPTPLE